MFRSKLCKSNRISAWNLAFPVFISPIVYKVATVREKRKFVKVSEKSGNSVFQFIVHKFSSRF